MRAGCTSVWERDVAPAVMYGAERGICCVAQGDDFVAEGLGRGGVISPIALRGVFGGEKPGGGDVVILVRKLLRKRDMTM